MGDEQPPEVQYLMTSMEHATPVGRKAIKPKNATVRRTLVVMTLPGTKTKVVATEDVEVSEAEVVVAAVEAADAEEEEVEVNVISPESNVFTAIRRSLCERMHKQDVLL